LLGKLLRICPVVGFFIQPHLAKRVILDVDTVAAHTGRAELVVPVPFNGVVGTGGGQFGDIAVVI
jgi:hypothetical protein